MSKYEIKGDTLHDPYRRKIATARDRAVYDAENHLVATIREDGIYDSNGNLMASIQGSSIYDGHGALVGTTSDAQASIRGAEEGLLHIALWYCFVR